MTVDFGDFEPDDAFAAEGEPDTEQVAIRLHEIRVELESLIGQPPDAFEDLDPQEQALARAIAMVIVEWLVEHDPDEGEGTARTLHNVRRYWSGNVLPEWDDLPEDHREIAVAIMTNLLAWLRRQGALR